MNKATASKKPVIKKRFRSTFNAKSAERCSNCDKSNEICPGANKEKLPVTTKKTPTSSRKRKATEPSEQRHKARNYSDPLSLFKMALRSAGSSHKSVTYELSDSSDNEVNISIISSSSDDLTLLNVDDILQEPVPSTSVLQNSRSKKCDESYHLNDGTFKSESTGSSRSLASDIASAISVLSGPETDTEISTMPLQNIFSAVNRSSDSEDFDSYLNDLLASSNVCSNAASLNGPLGSSNDFLRYTQQLLSSTSDLVELDDVLDQSQDDSVIILDTSASPVEVSHKTRNVSSTKSVETVCLDDYNEQPKRSLGDCPICLEALGVHPVASTMCGHIFCEPCIRNCIQNTKRCPNCRKRLTTKQVHPLFI